MAYTLAEITQTRFAGIQKMKKYLHRKETGILPSLTCKNKVKLVDAALQYKERVEEGGVALF